MEVRSHYRTVVISDVHLGSAYAKVKEVGDFLSSVDCDRLVLNGDIIDGWQIQRKSAAKRWNSDYTRFMKIIMKMMENHNTEVIYLRGNHDDFLDNLVPVNLSNISFLRDYVLESEGHRFFVTHGDVFDSVTSKMEWLAKLGDISYTALLKFNNFYNRMRARRGKPYFSMSQAIKHKVKKAVSFVSGFERMLADLARSKHCDGVICGHIHYPEDRMIDGIRYLNSGDLLESLSALIEDESGNWRIYRYRDEFLP